MIEEPHTTNFRSQNNHLFSPRIAAKLEYSIAQFLIQPTSKATSPSSQFLLSLHLNHLIITLHPAWNHYSNTTVVNTISQFNNSDTKTHDEIANSELNQSTFSQPPLNKKYDKVISTALRDVHAYDSYFNKFNHFSPTTSH